MQKHSSSCLNYKPSNMPSKFISERPNLIHKKCSTNYNTSTLYQCNSSLCLEETVHECKSAFRDGIRSLLNTRRRARWEKKHPFVNRSGNVSPNIPQMYAKRRKYCKARSQRKNVEPKVREVPLRRRGSGSRGRRSCCPWSPARRWASAHPRCRFPATRTSASEILFKFRIL